MNSNLKSTLVFIDTSISDYQQLMEGLDPSAEVVLLDSDKDGIEAITKVLARRQNLNNIQILSHGSQGALNLGTARLHGGNLQDYRGQLEQWSSAMAPGADILLYGCDVAAGDEGKSFVQELSRIVGVDVAASEDLTGSSALGGNWEFEFQTGEIEARSLLSREARNNFQGTLNVQPGLVQTYYRNTSNSNPESINLATETVVDRSDTIVTEDWDGGRPAGTDGGNNNWNAVWEGWLVPPTDGIYQFRYEAGNNLVKFEFDSDKDGELEVVDDWQKLTQWVQEPFYLDKGFAYKTKVSFYDEKDNAYVGFQVKQPGSSEWQDDVGDLFVPDAPPTISIEAVDENGEVNAREGEELAWFKINGIPSSGLVVYYTVDGLSGASNADLGFFDLGFTTFLSGGENNYLAIPIIDDSIWESGEQIRVTIEPNPNGSNPDFNYFVDTENNSATKTIIDNDMSVSFGGSGSISIAEGNEETLQLNVSDGGFQEETTVNLNSTGSGLYFKEGQSVTSVTSVTFDDETSKNVTVTVVDDFEYKSNDTYQAGQISVVANDDLYRLGNEASINVTAEDDEPQLSIDEETTNAEEGVTTGVFTINLTKINPQNFDLSFRIESSSSAKLGTLTDPDPDSDYKLFYDFFDENGDNLNLSSNIEPGTNEFLVPSGTKSIKLRVEPINDYLWEEDETVTITLLQHANSTSSIQEFYGVDDSQNTATVTIADNEPTVSLGAVVMPEEGFGFGTTIQDLGAAIDLDGGDYVALQVSEEFDLIARGTFTQEAWVYPMGTGLLPVISDGAYQTDSAFAFPQISLKDNDIIVGFGDGVDYYELESTDALNPNSWNHVATTFDGTDYKIYVNGTEVASTDAYAGKTPFSSKQFDIGHNGNNTFQGAIDEVRLWNVPRTAAEIQNGMLTPLTGEESGLVGYWSFENNLNDASGNDNHGSYGGGGDGPSYIDNPAPQIGYIEVNLDKPFDGPQGLWVNYDIDGSAEQDIDYFNSRYRLVSTEADSERDGIIIPQGETSGRIYIVANPDEYDEEDEVVQIALKPHNFEDEPGSSDTNTNYRVDPSNGNGEVTIKDSDAYRDEVLVLDRYDRPIDDNNPLYVDEDGEATVSVKLAGKPLPSNGSSVGQSLSLDGTNDRVEIPHSDSLSLPETFTIETWVNPAEIKSDWQPLITKEADDGTERNYGLFMRRGSLGVLGSFFNTEGVGQGVNSQADLNLNEWNHLALTYDGSTLKLYVNGEPDASATPSGTPFQSDHPVKIGDEISVFTPFNGEIDEVRIWNDARSESEIQNNLNATLEGNEAGLVGYWNFNNDSGTTATDLTSNGNDGTLQEGASFTDSNRIEYSTAEATFGQTLSLDGTNDWLQIPHSDSLNLPDTFTIETWVNPAQIKNGWQPLIAKTDDNGRERNYGLYIRPRSLRLHASFMNEDEAFQSFDSQGSLNQNEWNHLAMTYDGSRLKLYVNGQLDINEITSGKPFHTEIGEIGNPVKIGKEISAYLPFSGEIDEVRIWNVARSETEIQDNLDVTLEGNEAGLVGYWNFNNDRGTTATDLTSNGNDGTLEEGASFTDLTSAVVHVGFDDSNWDEPQTLRLTGLTPNSTLSYNYGNTAESIPLTAIEPQLLETEEGSAADLEPVTPEVSIVGATDAREGDDEPGEFIVNLTAPAPEGGLEVEYSANIPGKPSPSNGLKGEYFSDINLENLAFTRTDETVNFNWFLGSPSTAQVGNDLFSIRWTGYVVPRYTEEYTFTTIADNGVRLWVNEENLIDQWVQQSQRSHEGKITLEAGKAYAITLEYFEAGGGSRAQLVWESASQAKEIVPEEQLLVDDPNSDYEELPATIAVEAGATTAVLPIAAVDDETSEETETVEVTLENGSGYSLNSESQTATIEISDDDGTDLEVASKVESTDSETGETTTTYISTSTPVQTSEEGTSQTVGVRLPSRPTANVTVELVALDDTEGEVAPAQLTFTPDNWDEYQDVTITGKADSAVDEDVEYAITLDAESTDPNFNSQAVIPVVNADVDETGVVQLNDEEEEAATPDPSLPTASVKVVEQMTETQAGKVEISLSEPVAAGETIEVNFSASDDTATEGEDYYLGVGANGHSPLLFINSVAEDGTELFEHPFGDASFGNAAKPVFGDIDGDGDVDAVVGAADGTVSYFENVGSSDFEARIGANNPFNAIATSANSAPALADLNNDGKLDLVVGEANGDLSYFVNKSNSTYTIFFEATQIDLVNPFASFQTNANSAPTLGDLNSDGLPDLVLGAADGSVTYYFNTGTEGSPVFNPNAGVRAIDVGVNAMPQLIDWDLDGDLDLLVTDGNGEIEYLTNNDATEPDFTETNGKPLGDVTISPDSALAFADVDEDGDTDAFIGTPGDGIEYLEQFQGVVFEEGEQTKEVTIQPIADVIDEGDGETFSLSVDGGFGYEVNVEEGRAELTISDDDTAGVTVEANQTATATSETGDSLSYSVKLDTQPTGPVEVYLGSSDETEGLLEATGQEKADVVMLEFTPDNWDEAQEFTVSGVDDDIDDGDIPYKILTTVQGEDSQYRDLDVEAIALTNNDDADEAKLTVEKMTDGVAEGRENIYKVKLSSQPTGEVRVIADPNNDQIRLNDEDYGDRMTLVFDETNWNVEQVVRVSAFDDNLVEFAHQAEIDFEVESGEYKDFESEANNSSSDGAIELGEIQGGYTWKNLALAGSDRDWFKFTLADAATAEDFVRVSVTEGDESDLQFNIYKVDDLTAAVKSSSTSDIGLDLSGLEAGEYYLEVFSPQRSNLEYDLVVGDESYKYEESNVEPLEVQIIDDDLPTAKIISGPTAAELSSEPGYFTIALNAPVPTKNGSTGIEVNYEIIGGTAQLQQGEELGDYKVTNEKGSVRIAPGEVQNNLIIVPIDDKLVEDLDVTVTDVGLSEDGAADDKQRLELTLESSIPANGIATILPDSELQLEVSPGEQIAAKVVGSNFDFNFEEEKVHIYTGSDYQGETQELEPGEYDVAELEIGNDELTSLTVPEGFKVTLYEDANFGGRTLELTEDSQESNDLSSENLGNVETWGIVAYWFGGIEVYGWKTENVSWNDRVSSIKVETIDRPLSGTVTVEVDDEDAGAIVKEMKGKVKGETVGVKLLPGEGYQLGEENVEATLGIQDDDVPGVRIVQVGENTTVGEGETADFAISLLSEPVAPVTIELTPGAEVEFVNPLGGGTADVTKQIYSFASSDVDGVTTETVNGVTFDIKLESLANTDRGDAVTFSIKLANEPSSDVTVKIYDDNDVDSSDNSHPFKELTFTSGDSIENQVTGQSKPSNWEQWREVTLYELDQDSNGGYAITLEVNDQQQTVAITSAVEQVSKETTSITIQPENWFKLEPITISGSEDDEAEPGIFHTTSISYDVKSDDANYEGIFVPNQTIEVVDRVLNAKETARGMREGLSLLQDSIDEMSLPLVGKLKGKNPSIIGDLGNALAKNTEDRTGLTASKLKDTIESVLQSLGLEFFNVTTEVSEQETVVNLVLSKQQQYDVPLDANLGIPALGLQTEGNLNADFNFDLSLSFGIHKQFGFFLDTDKTKTFLDAGIRVDLSNFQGRGSLGFLALDFVDDPENPTKLEATFTATLNDVVDIEKVSLIQPRSATADSGGANATSESTLDEEFLDRINAEDFDRQVSGPESDEILAEKIAAEEAAIEKELAKKSEVRKVNDDSVEVSDESLEASDESAEVSEESADASEESADTSDDSADASDDSADTSDDSADTSDESADASDDSADASDDSADASDDSHADKLEEVEAEELSEEVTGKRSKNQKKADAQTDAESEGTEAEELSEEVTGKQKNKQQKGESSATPETDEEDAEESPTGDRSSLIQRRNGSGSTETLSGDSLTQRLTDLGISAFNSLLPNGITVDLTDSEAEVRLAVQTDTNLSEWIGLDDLPALTLTQVELVYDKTQESYTFSADATVGSNAVGLSGTLATAGNQLQWTQLQGSLNGTEINYVEGSDFSLKGVTVADVVSFLQDTLGLTDVVQNLGSDLGIDFTVDAGKVGVAIANLDLEGLVKAIAGDSNLPLPLPSISNLVLDISGDEGDRSYNFSAAIDGVAVSYQDLENGGYKLSLGNLDLEDLGIPLPLEIQNAEIEASGNAANRSYNVIGQFNNSEIAFAELENDGYQISLGNINLESLGLPIPLTIESAELLKEANGNLGFSGTFNGAAVSFTELENGGYQISLGNIDLASLGLPIPVTINSAKLVKDGEDLDLSGTFNGADVSLSKVGENNYELSLGNIDLESLGLPIPVTINSAKLVKEDNENLDLSGTFNGAEVSLSKVGEDYEIALGNIDLESLGLPIPVTINSAKVVKEDTGNLSLSGTFNGVDLSLVKDGNDYRFDLSGSVDVSELVKAIASDPDLPIPSLAVDNPALVVTSDTDKTQYTFSTETLVVDYVKNADNTYAFNVTDLPVGDLTEWMEVELGIESIGSFITGDIDVSLQPDSKAIVFDGDLDLSALVKAIANDPNLPIPSLNLNSPSLSYSDDGLIRTYAFTLADNTSVTYTKETNNEYRFEVDDFPVGDLANWLQTELGISGASNVFSGTLDVIVTPNQKEVTLNGNVDIGLLLQPIINYNVPWQVDNPRLIHTTSGGETVFSFSDDSKEITYTKDAKGQTTLEVDDFPIGELAEIVTSGLGLNGTTLPDWTVDATISPTETSLTVDGSIGVADFANLVGLNLPNELNSLAIVNPVVSVGQDNSYEFSGTGEVTLSQSTFGDFTEIAALLPGIESTSSGITISGDIVVSKSADGTLGLQGTFPALGAIQLERDGNDRWELVALEDGDRLTLTDLAIVATDSEYSFTDLFNYEFKGDANLGLKAETSIAGNPAFPSFSVDIAAGLPLFNYGNQQEADSNGFEVEFNNMELDLGTFLSDFAQPIMVQVDDIIDPIKPVMEALQADTKLLSELGLENEFDTDGKSGISLLEIAETLGGSNDPRIKTAIQFARTLDSIIDTIDFLSEQEGDVIIPLGDYNLADFNAASQDDADSASNQSGSVKTSSQPQTTPDDEAKKNKTYKALSALEGFSIPLIEEPVNAVYLFLGKDAELIEYDIPDIDFGFDIEQIFPIWAPPVISGELGGAIDIKTDLAVGFDTAGINQWKNEHDFDPTKAYLIFDGFYLDDLDEDGNDKEEFVLKGDVSAGLSVSAGVAKATVEGGVEGRVGFDIQDVGEKTGNSDGKIRGSEIVSRISNPLSLFELYGTIDAYLKGKIRVGVDAGVFEVMKTVWKKEFARFNLAEFRIDESGFSGSVLGGKFSTSYIAGATVFLDANFNGMLDENEPVTLTDSNGEYNLEFEIEEYDTNGNGQLDEDEAQIVAMGGIDTSSGVPVTTQMTGSVESTQITPLTNLKNFLVEGEYAPSPEAAETLISEKLGLPSGPDLGKYDPIAAIGGDRPGVQRAGTAIYLGHVELQNLVVHANALLQGANPRRDSLDVARPGKDSDSDVAEAERQKLEEAVTEGLAEALTSEKASFDLSDAADVEAILVEIAARSSRKEISSEIVTAVAEMVAEANALVDEMAAAAQEQTMDLIMPAVAPVKRTTQGELAEITEQLGAGDLTAAEARSQFTAGLEAGNRLEQQIISDTRNVKVYATGDLDENGEETTEIVIELGEPAPNQGVQLLYNISGTATEGEDYEITGGVGANGHSPLQLYIEPGETQATFEISTIDDDISEPTESITLNLRYAAESFAIDPAMQVAVVNIIDDEDQTDAESQPSTSFEGTLGDDTIIGTEEPDDLSGSYGHDIIEGKGGSDLLKGNYGRDSISGGEGGDRIEGNYDADFLAGDGGNDFILGGSGNDTIEGGEGNDQLYGNSDNDSIEGNEGSDRIEGGDGNDILKGGANNDWLVGGSGNNILIGGEGEDVLNGGGDDANYFVFNSPEEGGDVILDFEPTKGDKIIIDSQGFGTDSLDDFQFINGSLYFQEEIIAVIQNEGVSYNFFQDLGEIIEFVEGEENITTPENPPSTAAEPSEIEANAPSIQTRNSPGEPTNLLEEILDRGYLKVAALTGRFGFSIEDEEGEWDGYGIEWARALAAGLFGDPDKVEYIPVGGSSAGLEAVASGEADFATSNLNLNQLRDASFDVDFAPISIYDTRAVIVRADSGIERALDLEGKKVGLADGTTGKLNFETFMERNGIEYEPVVFANGREMFEAYDNGLVDAVPADRTTLIHIKETFSDPDNHVILDEEMAKETIALALPENESEWADVVRWMTYAPIQAEEFGINSSNIEEFKASDDPAIRRFLGVEGDNGQTLGVPNNFVENVIKTVGNYEELYDRYFAELNRNRNQIWQNGGLLYSPPFSGTIPSETELIDNDESNLLQTIIERGVVRVGVTGKNPGFAQEVDGEWQGFDVDLGRALAAALFGDPDKVEFVIQSFSEGFPNVANGEVDVSAMGVTHNLVRDAGAGVDYGPTYLYTGQGILVKEGNGIVSLPMLNGRTVGIVGGTTTEQLLQDALEQVGGSFVPVGYATNDELFAAYDNGEIDAVVQDLTLIANRIPTLSNPDEHRILDEVLSKEPLALVIDENQSDWADVVRWVTHALVQAEEWGITQDNVDELVANSTDPEIRRFLGVQDNLGEALGLPNDYTVQIIKAVGNYGEVYDSNLNGDILPRGINELFTEFGLQYAPPVGGTPTLSGEEEPETVETVEPQSIEEILAEFFPPVDGEEEEESTIEAAQEETAEEDAETQGDPDAAEEDAETGEGGDAEISNPFAELETIGLQPEASNAPEAIATPEQNDEPKVMMGSDLPDSLLGGSGDDLLMGMRADDMLMGYEGDDTAYGGKGNDLIMGGADGDILHGDNDNDTVSGEGGADMVNGNRGQDAIDGGSGEDMLHGGKGDDFIQGGSDNDTLLGEKGNDSLEGNEGDDLLDGGLGDDTLVGGQGSDRFVLAPGNGVDLILDFEDGIDFLQLEGDIALEQLTLTAEAGNTVVEFGEERLAVLSGVEPAVVTAEDLL